MKWPTVTNKTPIEEIHRIHQTIWQYVMKYGEKPDTPYVNDCVLCEYARTLSLLGYCDICPAVWYENKSNRCYERDTPYTSWAREDRKEERAKLAKEIRDIPFKYELEKE